MAQPKTYSISEAGALLGVGYRRTRQLIASGELRAANVAAPGARPVWTITRQAITAAQRRRVR